MHFRETHAIFNKESEFEAINFKWRFSNYQTLVLLALEGKSINTNVQIEKSQSHNFQILARNLANSFVWRVLGSCLVDSYLKTSIICKFVTFVFSNELSVFVLK